MEVLEREPDRPEGYCEAFLSVFPVRGAAVSTIGEILGSETRGRLRRRCSSARRAAVRPRRRPVLGCDAGGSARSGVGHPRERTGTVARVHRVRRQGRHRSLFAFPLSVGPLRFGAVDLYSVDPVRLSGAQARQAGALAEVVSRHVLRRALNAMGADEGEAVSAFSRRLVHQASGVVLAQLDVSADDARLVIQGQAFATEQADDGGGAGHPRRKAALRPRWEAGSRSRNERRDAAATARDLRQTRRHARRRLRRGRPAADARRHVPRRSGYDRRRHPPR